MKILRALASVLLAVSMATAPVFAMNWEMKKSIQHQAMHEIVMLFTDEETGKEQGALCTAYAVGPHTLMTAQHCDVGAKEVYVDPVSRDTVKDHTSPHFEIVDKEFDREDHMLLDLKGENFKATIDNRGYTATGVRAPVQGEMIHWWGNPAGIRDQYREGRVMGQAKWDVQESPDNDPIDGPSVWLVEAPAIGGDSGSAVFGEDGRLVGIVTFSIAGGHVMGMFPIQFSPEQIQNSLK